MPRRTPIRRRLPVDSPAHEAAAARPDGGVAPGNGPSAGSLATRPPWLRPTTPRQSDACAAASRCASERDLTSDGSETRRTRWARCSCGGALRARARCYCEKRWRFAQRRAARSWARRCIIWQALWPRSRRTTRGAAKPSTPTAAPYEPGRLAAARRARKRCAGRRSQAGRLDAAALRRGSSAGDCFPRRSRPRSTVAPACSRH